MQNNFLEKNLIGLNKMSQEIHFLSKSKGWWDEEDRNFGEVIALFHSELSEAFEEYRKGKKVNEVYYSKDGKPEGILIELADCIIRILDFCGKNNLDMEKALLMKHEYNKTRSYRHGNKKA